ncbi:crosslink repair DNA glycosylase YcaQ family protein [Devosia sp.]|uniref:winged helix-turn-helix domain-containing protein n=1 Tax=Devosia sp. TaxID=1871048 RepID=UPI001AD3DF8A|nr:crosslink repair DNA glycosylase YcaQ family protein [Devosia sp.]MBN9310103.1 YcaQ family DNA glycosylase [Devosia sp.]
MKKPVALSIADARRIWLNATRLDERAPFGDGPAATLAAIEHLGYVQIDTINVIERAHHHILYSRIPNYRRTDLAHVQSQDKSVFEYWTHALAYLPLRDIGFYLNEMRHHRSEPMRWYADADPNDLKRLLRQIRKDGAISIRDIEDEELVEKDHPWASRKPSKRVLQYGCYSGELAISERNGMVKTYELIDRHFGWPPRPRAATERQIDEHLIERALTAQGLISGPSVMHPRLRFTPEMAKMIESRVRTKKLVPVMVGDDTTVHYVRPETLEQPTLQRPPLVHILSPFDPLIIQRRRLKLFFGYDHVFEAYVPKARRQYGYFTLPVLVGDEVVAAMDLKTDRAAGRMLIQSWHWIGAGNAAEHKAAIEEELGRFERFQLG